MQAQLRDTTCGAVGDNRIGMIWQAEDGRFLPVPQVNRTPIALLKSVDRMRDTLLARGLHLATADGGFDPEAEV